MVSSAFRTKIAYFRIFKFCHVRLLILKIDKIILVSLTRIMSIEWSKPFLAPVPTRSSVRPEDPASLPRGGPCGTRQDASAQPGEHARERSARERPTSEAANSEARTRRRQRPLAAGVPDLFGPGASLGHAQAGLPFGGCTRAQRWRQPLCLISWVRVRV